MNKSSKIYVAGHKGLVGSALINCLQKKGYNNLLFRTRSELDLINQKEVDFFFQKEKPDYVILAAAKVGGILANNTYRAEFIYENLMIQNNIIHSSYLNKVKKLLFLGSTCIYPKNVTQPITESALLTSELEYTNEPYAIAKISGIKMCESYNLQYGTNFISIMPTNLYGLNDNFDLKNSHVLPALVRKIHLAKCINDKNWDSLRKDINKRPISGLNASNSIIDIISFLENFGITSDFVEIWGTGKPTREFMYSADLADACVFLLKNVNFSDTYTASKEIKNSHINIGTGEEISIFKLAKLIKEVINYKGSFLFDKSKPDGVLRKVSDLSKINSLGWKAKTSLKEGINIIYQSYIE
tara:strand:+ start:6376 stop:7443 length:1068 start_codon:yes stop_codon:yes gene_type:complete